MDWNSRWGSGSISSAPVVWREGLGCFVTGVHPAVANFRDCNGPGFGKPGSSGVAWDAALQYEVGAGKQGWAKGGRAWGLANQYSGQ
eukprot:8725673-Alexandrium_andersonii.AAC.1